MSLMQSKPFLRVPPFPGARVTNFSRGALEARALDGDQVRELIQSVRRLRVGGDYWASQPELPPGPYVLLKACLNGGLEIARELASGWPLVVWTDAAGERPPLGQGEWSISGQIDPWHLLQNASHVVVDADDELALLAAIAEVPLTCIDEGPYAQLGEGEDALISIFRELVTGQTWLDPFTGQPVGAGDAIRLCAFWRELIDSNRDIVAAIGFAFWKRPTVAALLWAGSGDVPFASSIDPKKGAVAIWKSRAPRSALEQLASGAWHVVEVEDGFIRSAGLGADCVPPLSIVVDPLGIYFDPGKPSLLEQLIQSGEIAPELVRRAGELRELIVSSGVSKYGAGTPSSLERRTGKRHILVPGQVEDDRSVQCGGGDVRSNVELLRRVRASAIDAYIIYKPHPDVEAGHRKGAIADPKCLSLADEIVRDEPMPSLIDLADEVHVNTSLAGFEALLRSKPVTTYGVPFYAGWGLTRDLGDVPARRSAKVSLDELVAAALFLYPRYLDPMTGLPCPPEVLVRRIAERSGRAGGVVVKLRRMHGRWKKRLAGAG